MIGLCCEGINKGTQWYHYETEVHSSSEFPILEYIMDVT